MPRPRKAAAPKTGTTQNQSDATRERGGSDRSFFRRITDLVRDNPKTALSAGVAVLAGAVAAVAMPFGGSSKEKISGKQKRRRLPPEITGTGEAASPAKKSARKKRAVAGGKRTSSAAKGRKTATGSRTRKAGTTAAGRRKSATGTSSRRPAPDTSTPSSDT